MGVRGAGWPRIGAAAVAAIGVLAISGAIAYRVLAPAETITVATAAYPAVPEAQPGVIGSLAAAPLVVDGRLRVYATARQVRADGPVDARTQRTPYWSYRRWPQQLLGVVATGGTVVSRWSDGDLVALDARTGRVAWRSAGPSASESEYAGGSTGARTVYEPEGLLVAGTAVLVREEGRLRALDTTTGRELWRTAMEDCLTGGFTTTGGRFAAIDTCQGRSAVRFYDVATGRPGEHWEPPGAGASLRVEPLGCAAARSACAALRTAGDGGSRGWLVGGAHPVAAPALDPPISAVAGDVAVVTSGGEAVARSLRDGAEVWRWSAGEGAVEVLAAQSGAVHLLTDARELVTLDPATGAERSRFVLAYGRERVTWIPGHVAARDGFIAVERMIESTGSTEEHFSALPVILART